MKAQYSVQKLVSMPVVSKSPVGLGTKSRLSRSVKKFAVELGIDLPEVIEVRGTKAKKRE